jgi:hypothetical protein
MDARTYLRSKFIGPLPQEAGLSGDDVESYLRARLGLQPQDPVSVLDGPAPAGVADSGEAAGHHATPVEAAQAQAASLMSKPLELPHADVQDVKPLAPVAAKSGLALVHDLKQEASRNQAAHINLMQDPDQVKKAMQVFTGAPADEVTGEPATPGAPAYLNQERGIDNLQEMLRARLALAKPQLDLTPLMSLTDAWTGSKMAGNYKAPKNDDADTILAAQAKLQDDRRDLFKSLLGTISAQKGGGVYIDQAGLKSTAGSKASASDPDAKASKGPDPTSVKLRLMGAWRQDSKDAKDAYVAAQQAVNTLFSGSKVGLEAFKNFMARASGEKGPLSVDDVHRFVGSQALLDRIDRSWEKWTTGQMTDSDQEDMKTLANAYVTFQKGRLDNLTDMYVNQVGPQLNMSPDETQKLLIPGKGFGAPASAMQHNKPGKGQVPQTMTPAERKARIQALLKKQAGGK